ncbi:MAG TPA: hypothetical protein VG796_14140 [Verrucomicrobiales bacterium]|nr:hypothetical protein [Verrucomicrobiales bacterium]
MPTKKAASQEPTLLEIATLAARFLPSITLDDTDPTKMNHDEFRRAIEELTTGKGRKSGEDYQYPEVWATPFEAMAEEAVKRARILLDAAAGRMRRPRVDHLKKTQENTEAMRRRVELLNAIRKSDFRKVSGGDRYTTLEKVIAWALPRVYKHNRENAWGYFREYLSRSIASLRAGRYLPPLEITFEELATEEQKANSVDTTARAHPPACIVLPHGPDYIVTAKEFPEYVVELRDFYQTEGPAIRQRLLRAKGAKGAKLAKPLKEKPLFSARDEAKFRASDKKRRKSRPGA